MATKTAAPATMTATFTPPADIPLGNGDVDAEHRSTTIFGKTFHAGEEVDVSDAPDRIKAKLAGNIMFVTSADAPDKFVAASDKPLDGDSF